MEGNHQICPFVFSSTFQQLSFQMSKFGGHLLKEQINLYFYKQIQIQEIIKCVDDAREGILDRMALRQHRTETQASIGNQSCMN